MFLAVVIDATDGTMARAARVQELIPWFDGARLEDIIDYINYVIVPSLFFVRADLLPRQDALWLAVLPLIASAYGFCHKEAKTPDHFFLGFPSYWNILVFYLYVIQSPPWINGFAIIVLSLLIFLPVRFLYPSRSPCFRALTNSLAALWGVALLLIIYLLPQASPNLIFVSLIFPAYYTVLSLWLEFHRVTA